MCALLFLKEKWSWICLCSLCALFKAFSDPLFSDLGLWGLPYPCCFLLLALAYGVLNCTNLFCPYNQVSVLFLWLFFDCYISPISIRSLYTIAVTQVQHVWLLGDGDLGAPIHVPMSPCQAVFWVMVPLVLAIMTLSLNGKATANMSFVGVITHLLQYGVCLRRVRFS